MGLKSIAGTSLTGCQDIGDQFISTSEYVRDPSKIIDELVPYNKSQAHIEGSLLVRSFLS